MSHRPVTIKPEQIARFDMSWVRFGNGAAAVTVSWELELVPLVCVQLISKPILLPGI